MNLKNLILSLDMYARSPNLLINKRASFPTYPGSIFSILTIVLFVYLFSSSDFFQKINPKVVSQVFTFESTPTLKITKQTFPLFWVVTDVNGAPINDPSIFQIDVKLLRFTKNFKNEIAKFEKFSEKQISLRKCIEKDISNLVKFSEKEIKGIVENLACFDEEVEIKGDIEENEISQLTATISPCQNGTSKNGTEIVCKSEEDIEKFFNDTKSFSLAFVSFNEDVEKFDNPFLNNMKFYSYKIVLKEQKQSLMTLKQSIFKTISGITDENLIISLKLDELVTDFIMLEPKPEALVYLVLQVSRKYEKITRYYQSIGEALASAISLVNVFAAIIKFIMVYLNNILYKLDVVNKLYCFESENEKDNATRLYQSKKKEDVYNEKNKFYKKDRLNISIWRALLADFKRSLKLKTNFKENLYLKTQNILNRDTNLPFILQKLHEIEKIKLLLFDNTQMFIFNFLLKPRLFLHHFKEEFDYSKKLEVSLELSDELNNGHNKNLGLYESQLKENIKIMMESNAKMDKKLLLLLDQRFLSLCEMRNETSLYEIPDEKKF